MTDPESNYSIAQIFAFCETAAERHEAEEQAAAAEPQWPDPAQLEPIPIADDERAPSAPEVPQIDDNPPNEAITPVEEIRADSGELAPDSGSESSGELAGAFEEFLFHMRVVLPDKNRYAAMAELEPLAIDDEAMTVKAGEKFLAFWRENGHFESWVQTETARALVGRALKIVNVPEPAAA